MFATGPKALPCQRTKPRTITILRCRTRGDESTIWPRRALQLCCGHRGRFPLGERHGNDAHAAKRFAGGERGAQCPRRGRACMHHPHGDARGLRQCQDAQFGRVRENARVSGSHRVSTPSQTRGGCHRTLQNRPCAATGTAGMQPVSAGYNRERCAPAAGGTFQNSGPPTFGAQPVAVLLSRKAWPSQPPDQPTL